MRKYSCYATMTPNMVLMPAINRTLAEDTFQLSSVTWCSVDVWRMISILALLANEIPPGNQTAIQINKTYHDTFQDYVMIVCQITSLCGMSLDVLICSTDNEFQTHYACLSKGVVITPARQDPASRCGDFTSERISMPRSIIKLLIRMLLKNDEFLCLGFASKLNTYHNEHNDESQICASWWLFKFNYKMFLSTFTVPAPHSVPVFYSLANPC
jgi:hypothetical protein